jgi:hypothetical protein
VQVNLRVALQERGRPQVSERLMMAKLREITDVPK